MTEVSTPREATLNSKMAASWCYLRLWYKTTREKLYKTPRRLIAARQLILHNSFRCYATVRPPFQDNFQKITYDVNTVSGQKKDTTVPLPSVYSPQYVEAAWYDWWVSQGFFKSQSEQAGNTERESFVMLLPPPNVTGTLHLGHALTSSIQDALIRWHRMRGDNVLWIPGTDHAGIATQVVVEKTLWAEHQQTRHHLGRDRFQAEVWKWKEAKGNVIENQMKSLGLSLDWSRNFFTLDKVRSRAVTEAFVRLHETGKIYRDHQLVNWSCSLQSSISDIEVDSVPLEGRTKRQVPGYSHSVQFGVLTSFAYPVEDSDEEAVVSTTRLETMLADTAVAVHPEDPRYIHLVGRRVRHPLCHRSLPIIADSFVDRGFGSGAVKITPGHDLVDWEVGQRHGLPSLSILDDTGRVCGDVPEEWNGLRRFEARGKVALALQDLGLHRGEKSHAMVLPVCSRSGDVVEPRLKEQWFLSCRAMAERAVQAVQRGELTLYASHHEAVWFEWLTKVRDWCLSRQLWWGHRIPAYKFQTDAGEKWVAARSEAEAIQKFRQLHSGLEPSSIKQDDDVLDTWFSSALLPLSAFQWPENTGDLRQSYPLTLMETGHDILFFWVARMVMLGLELTDTLPFRQVLLHGIIRDAQGRKMSKSLGNVVDPLDVIHGATLEELHSRVDIVRLTPAEVKTAQEGQRKHFPQGIPQCGTDALRFTLCSYDYKADAVQMDVLHTRTYRLFCNKIWQAFRFTKQHIQGDFTPLDTFTLSGAEEAVDLWVLSALSKMVEDCHVGFTSLNLHQATKALHQFWLTQFCDVYLEYCKTVFQSENTAHQEAVQQILYFVTDTFLCAVSPFLPYLTEELFQRLPAKSSHWPQSVCVAPYPQPEQWYHAAVEKEVKEALEICNHVLSIRHNYNISKPSLPVYIVVKSATNQTYLDKYKILLRKLCKADPVHIITGTDADIDTSHYTVPPGCATSVLNSSCCVHVQLQGHVDFARELDRLAQRAQKISQQQLDVASRLSELVAKGKGHIPAAQKLQAKKESLTAQLKVITESMENVSKLQSS